jgi:ferredoxin
VIDPLFLGFLAQHDDAAWHRAVDRLLNAMHPVDRDATRIWLHFYPMRLQRAIDAAADPPALEHHLRLEGTWRLDRQRETSHWFLFGHRYWRPVREAVQAFASRPVAPGSLDLAAQVQSIARDLGARLQVDPSWLVGIVAVGVRTLQQAGLPDLPEDDDDRSDTGPLIGLPETQPDRIVARRGRGESQGLWGFLRGRRRQWRVTFDERRPDGGFRLIDTQHLTTAAAEDRRDYRSTESRCTEGPIPVQCRSCSCGSCWVGVLAGAQHLSAVDPRERATISALGYLDSDEPRPIVRLACMAQATGPVTLVIPPWNGQGGVRLDRALRET